MKKSIIAIIVLVLIAGLLICGLFMNKNEKRVVIYSCMDDERNQDLKNMVKEEFPDKEVVVQFIATGNLAAKVKTEGKNIEADIIVDLESAYIEDLKDYFADLSKFDSSNFVDGTIKSNKYFPWTKFTMALTVNKKYLEEHNLEVPTKYEDLLKPEYKDLIAMPDPKTSGTGYAFLLNAVNIMGEEEAFKYFSDLKENMREFTVSGSGPINLLKQGEIAIAMGMTFQGVQCSNENSDYQIVCLDTGAPYNTTSYGIISGREDNKDVIEVFNWLTSDFIKYDKENYLPDIILKNQENKVENYPIDFKDADMKGIDSIETKNSILEKWSEVNV